MARHHDVWVLTYAGFRRAIEDRMASEPIPGLHFAYHRLPFEDARFAEEGQWRTGLSEQAHYYGWQVTAGRVARRLHDRVGFDVAGHVTFVKYWSPCAVDALGIPFVWGPVGGGESAPRAFYETFSEAGLRYERRRDVARAVLERDVRVRRAARRAHLTFATTEETRRRVVALGSTNVEVRSAIGLPADEVMKLGTIAPAPDGPVRFLAVGRLLAFKGFRFALESFAEAVRRGNAAGDATLAGASLTLLGEGPERPALEGLVRDLGIGDRVAMPGHVSRRETFDHIGRSHALVQPSLHESGGGVCLEAMAAGRPVICFDLGGSAVHVGADAGIRVPAVGPAAAVAGLADAMLAIARDRAAAGRMGAAGREIVRRDYVWERRIEDLAARYREVASLAHRTAPAQAIPTASRIDA